MEKNPHLENLLNKVISDFKDKVGKEEMPANLLLKGHLFIESLLEEILAVFDYKNRELSRMGFHAKVKSLIEISQINENNLFKQDIDPLVPLLFAINDVRNNLAHDLHFELSEASVNKIGLLLGSKFIIKKYESGYKEVRENLWFCLRKIVSDLGKIIFLRTQQLKSTNEVGRDPKNVSLTSTSQIPSRALSSESKVENKKTD